MTAGCSGVAAGDADRAALRYCSAVVTHGGHGTVLKALAAGVPLVIAPLGRDQPDNAARVIRAGAGLRVRRTADIATLQRAISRVLDDHRYQDAARHMAEILAAERDDELVVDELERAAAGPHACATGPCCGAGVSAFRTPLLP